MIMTSTILVKMQKFRGLLESFKLGVWTLDRVIVEHVICEFPLQISIMNVLVQ